MITIIVGIPGAGKTLYAVTELRKEYQEPIVIDGEEHQRQVHYNNIPGLTIDEWQHLDDPTTWHTLPTGAVTIIDEAHKIFPARDWKKAVPEHIEASAELRHRGHDLVLLTQRPKDLDIFLRERCGRFIYLRSPQTKSDFAHAYLWPEYTDRYKDEREQEKSDKFTFTYPKEAFGTYKSAEIHTKKKYVPKSLKRVYLSLAALFLVTVPLMIWGFSKLYQKAVPDEELYVEVDTDVAGRIASDVGNRIYDYFEKYVPRVPGLPHTAPRFDSLVEAKDYPQLICVSSKTRCLCHTQQATVANVDEKMCRDIVENGYFDAAKQEKG